RPAACGGLSVARLPYRALPCVGAMARAAQARRLLPCAESRATCHSPAWNPFRAALYLSMDFDVHPGLLHGRCGPKLERARRLAAAGRRRNPAQRSFFRRGGGVFAADAISRLAAE